MEILLIRHGDPDYVNDCLTEAGRGEAQLLANMLGGVDLDGVFVSPLGRAQETCGFTQRSKGCVPVVLDWLEERNIEREGVCLWEASGDMFLSSTQTASERAVFDLEKSMPEGRGQLERVVGGFDALLETYGYLRFGDLYRFDKPVDQTIALFCHKGVILTLLADVLHWPLPMVFASLHIDPTGVTRLKLVEEKGVAHFKAMGINSLKHLG